MLKVYLTGPESSGKTSLSQSLSTYYDCALVPEYAREFLEKTSGVYAYEDLEKISQGQLNLEREIMQKESAVLISDTDQLVIYIWSMVKYAKVSENVKKALALQKPSLHLLCKPDLKWAPDPLRENPRDRDILFESYESKLKALGFNYAIISGLGNIRLENAIRLIDDFTKTSDSHS